MVAKEEHCLMSERIVQLETKQEFLLTEFDDYKESLTQCTEAINKLTETVVKHNILLQEASKKGDHFGTVFGGIITGVVTAILISILSLI